METRYRNYIIDKVKHSISVYRQLTGSDDIEFNVNNIKPILTSLGVSVHDPTILELIKEAENRADGKINPAHVEAALVSIAIENGDDEELYFEDAFDILDLDNDGYITSGDMCRVYERLDIRVSDDELIRLIDNIDFDRDGKIGYEDFRDFMLQSDPQSPKNLNDDDGQTDMATSNDNLSSSLMSHSGNSRRPSCRKLTKEDSQYNLVSEQKRLLLSYVGYVKNTASVVNYLQNQSTNITIVDKEQENEASAQVPCNFNTGSTLRTDNSCHGWEARDEEMTRTSSLMSDDDDSSCENITVVELLNNINNLTPNYPRPNPEQPEEIITPSPQPSTPVHEDSVDEANDTPGSWHISKINLHKDIDFYGPDSPSKDTREPFDETRIPVTIKAKETDLVSLFPSRRPFFKDKLSPNQCEMMNCLTVSPLGASMPRQTLKEGVHGLDSVLDTEVAGDGQPEDLPTNLNPLPAGLRTYPDPDVPDPETTKSKEARLYLAQRLARFIQHGYPDPHPGNDDSFIDEFYPQQRNHGYVKIENFQMPTIVTPRTPRAKTANRNETRRMGQETNKRPRTAIAALATPRDSNSTPRDYIIGDALVTRHLLTGRTRGNPVKESLVTHNTSHSGYVFGNLWEEDVPLSGSGEQLKGLHFVSSSIQPNRRPTPRPRQAKPRPRTSQCTDRNTSVREILAPREVTVDGKAQFDVASGQAPEDGNQVMVPVGMGSDYYSISENAVKDINKVSEAGDVCGEDGDVCIVGGGYDGGDDDSANNTGDRQLQNEGNIPGDEKERSNDGIKIPDCKETMNNENKDLKDQLGGSSIDGSTSNTCSVERIQSLYSSLNWVPEGLDPRTTVTSELTALHHTHRTVGRPKTSSQILRSGLDTTTDMFTRIQPRCVSVSGHIRLTTRGQRAHSAKPIEQECHTLSDSPRLTTVQIGQDFTPSTQHADQKNMTIFRPFHQRPRTSAGTLRLRRTSTTTTNTCVLSSPMSGGPLERRNRCQYHKNGRVDLLKEPKNGQVDLPMKLDSARESEGRRSSRESADTRVDSTREPDQWKRNEPEQRSLQINKTAQITNSSLTVKNISELVNGFPVSASYSSFRPLNRTLVVPTPRKARIIENSSISRSLETKCILLQHDDLSVSRKRAVPEVDDYTQKSTPVVKTKTVITLELPRTT